MPLPAWMTLRRAAPPERKPADNPVRVANITLRRGFGGHVYADKAAAAEAMTHPTLHRGVTKIATSVQTVEWYVERNGRRMRQAEADKLQAVLDSPCEGWSGADLRYWMALSLVAHGRIPFKVGVGSDRAPNALYPLPAGHVTRDVGADGIVTGYLYAGADGRGDPVRMPTRRKADGIAAYAEQIQTPGLAFGLDGWAYNAPLNSLGLPVAIVRNLLQRADDAANGRLNAQTIVSLTSATSTDAQMGEIMDKIEARQPGGPDAGKALVLANVDVKTININEGLEDIHTKVPLDDMDRRIAAALGIPLALLGLGGADGAKYASNFGESRLAFWEDTIIPSYLMPIAEGLTRALCPPGCRIRFDLDTIPALLDKRIERAARLKDVTILDDDEKRELIGYGPRAVPVAVPRKDQLSRLATDIVDAAPHATH